MTRDWYLGEPGWGWPDDVDKTGTETRCGYRYLPVINKERVDDVMREWQVTRVFVDEDDPEMLEDAQLIMSAPKLLEACQLLVALEDGDIHAADTRWKTARNMMREAIALATESTNVTN